ncbi:MAG: hypothetical protein ACE141_01795 [Bryobacteraceae bacterium]
MKKGTFTRNMIMLAIVGLLPAASVAGQTMHQVEMEREGVQLIRQLEEAARDVRYHAGRLNTFNSSTLISRWTHVHHLDRIKALVNEGLRPALTRLSEIQPQLPEWKQESIDKMLAAASTLAADVSSAYLAKSDAGTVPPFMNAEYKSLVSTIYAHAEELVKTSDAAGNYAAARLKADEAGLKISRK